MTNQLDNDELMMQLIKVVCCILCSVLSFHDYIIPGNTNL